MLVQGKSAECVADVKWTSSQVHYYSYNSTHSLIDCFLAITRHYCFLSKGYPLTSVT